MSDEDGITERVYDLDDGGVAKKCTVKQRVVEVGDEFYLSENEEILKTEIEDGWLTLWVMRKGETRVWALDDELVREN